LKAHGYRYSTVLIFSILILSNLFYNTQLTSFVLCPSP